MKATKQNISNSYGSFVRNRREELDIGLRSFAHEIEVSPTYQSQIERGIFLPPSEKTIVKTAKCLRVDEDELLARAGKISSVVISIIVDTPYIAALLKTHKALAETEWQKVNDFAAKLHPINKMRR